MFSKLLLFFVLSVFLFARPTFADPFLGFSEEQLEEAFELVEEPPQAIVPPDLKTGNVSGTWKLMVKAEDKEIKVTIKIAGKTKQIKTKSGEEVTYYPLIDFDKSTKEAEDQGLKPEKGRESLGFFIKGDQGKYSLYEVYKNKTGEVVTSAQSISKVEGNTLVLGDEGVFRMEKTGN